MAEKKEKVVFDMDKTYVVIATGTSEFMPKGEEFEVSGEMAKQFTEQGQAKLK